MRILYFGAESCNFVLNLCNGFAKAGNEVVAVVQDIDEYDKENPVELHENLKRINIDYNKYFNPEEVKRILMEEMTVNRPDVIIGSHTPISPVVAELARTYSIPWGIMLLDIPTDAMMTDRNRMRSWLYWFDVMKFADTMFFNTHIARDEYLKYTNQWFPDENIIPAGTEMPEEYEGAGIEIEGDYVVSISRLTPAKNCKMIAAALSLLKKDLKYVCIGRDRGELPLIRNICKNYGVEFEHKENITQKEKFELIKNSAMVIYPQNTEYIAGLSPWEGMFIGKPTLVADMRIFKDLYKEHPIYFEQMTPESLAQKMAFVRSLRKEHLKDKLVKGVEYAKETANYDNIAKDMLKVISKIVR